MGETAGNGHSYGGSYPGDGLPTDLPPVEPPSAGFIVQLFVIPAIIVAVIVAVWLLFGKLAGGERDPMDYVREIQSGNVHRRGRAAFELGSLIHNDARLSTDPVLLGELCASLEGELAKPSDTADEPKVRQYLALAIGAFQTFDAKTASGRAVDPLAVLTQAAGKDQPAPVRVAAAESLARHAARLKDTLDAPAAVKALGEASTDENAELREKATFALGFFGGNAPDVLRDRLDYADPFVRYNAAVALARRGDTKARGVVHEMLSPDELRKNVKIETDSERGKRNKESETRGKIEQIELQALQALEASIRQGHPELAALLRPEIESQSKSGLVSVRTEAAAVLKSLPARP